MTGPMKVLITAAVLTVCPASTSAQTVPSVDGLSGAWVRVWPGGSTLPHTGRVADVGAERIELVTENLLCGPNECVRRLSLPLAVIARLDVQRSKPLLVRMAATTGGAIAGYYTGAALTGGCGGANPRKEQDCKSARAIGAGMGIGLGLFMTRSSWRTIIAPVSPGDFL